MDVLSDLLKAVQLQGAMFYHGEFSAPWSFGSPPSCEFVRYLTPSAGHVIIFHLLTEGQASARLLNSEPIPLEAGDIVVCPHGDAHVLENGAPTHTIDMSKDMARIFSEGLKLSRLGGGGAVTKFVCGYMVCEPRMARLVLSGLPRLLKVPIRDDESGRWLENSIRFSVSYPKNGRAGGEAVLAKLSEVLFIETLRGYVARLPRDQTGWLAAAQDPQVGRSLALIHRDCAYPWSVANLAKDVGLSRSVLSERFHHFLGEPPMTYLARWRMLVAGQLLTTSRLSVAEIAAQVGYESESAFSRAFKRSASVPPARYRNELRHRHAARAPSIPADS